MLVLYCYLLVFCHKIDLKMKCNEDVKSEKAFASGAENNIKDYHNENFFDRKEFILFINSLCVVQILS